MAKKKEVILWSCSKCGRKNKNYEKICDYCKNDDRSFADKYMNMIIFGIAVIIGLMFIRSMGI